jgi:Curlin associated repeat
MKKGRAMPRRIAIVALAALVTMSATLAPVHAEGVSITLRPRGESADAIRTGLNLYGLFREAKNRAKTNQRGANNGAAIAQHGRGNTAYVFQRGRDNSGSITQNGNHNAFGLFQFGRRNSNAVVQNGNGEVGITLQGNW